MTTRTEWGGIDLPAKEKARDLGLFLDMPTTRPYKSYMGLPAYDRKNNTVGWCVWRGLNKGILDADTQCYFAEYDSKVARIIAGRRSDFGFNSLPILEQGSLFDWTRRSEMPFGTIELGFIDLCGLVRSDMLRWVSDDLSPMIAENGRVSFTLYETWRETEESSFLHPIYDRWVENHPRVITHLQRLAGASDKFRYRSGPSPSVFTQCILLTSAMRSVKSYFHPIHSYSDNPSSPMMVIRFSDCHRMNASISPSWGTLSRSPSKRTMDRLVAHFESLMET